MAIKEFADSVRIREEEVLPFTDAWDILMDRFKISEAHHGVIFYILKSFFYNLEVESEYFYDLTNSINALNFFISYLESAETAKSRGRFDSLNDSVNNALKLQIQSKYPSLPVTFDYPGITRFTVSYLYKFVRSNDPLLSYPLTKYKEIPSIEILSKIRDNYQFDLDNPHHY
jgi:hypothetical protein